MVARIIAPPKSKTRSVFWPRSTDRNAATALSIIWQTLAKSVSAIEVIVLNVQPLSESFRLRGYGSFKQDEVRDRLVTDLGKPIVDGVGRRLRKAGIDVTARVEIGDPVETILRYAATERCDLIVVGHPRPGAVRQWIARHAGISLGSVATSVAQLATIPVVVAK